MKRVLNIAFGIYLSYLPAAAFATDWCTADAKPRWAKILPSWDDRRIAPMSSADADFGFEPTRVWCWARDDRSSRDGWCIGLGIELCLHGGVDRTAVETGKYERLRITNQDTKTIRFITLFYD
jgi:hypothetical protein